MEIDAASLDALGLLKATHVPKQYDWLSDADKRLILMIFQCGEHGLARSVAFKEQKSNPDVLFRLEANSLTYWEKDKRGRDAYYVLTNRGYDLGKLFLSVARNQSYSYAVKARHSDAMQ